jgi:hypothetical protein
MHNLDGSAFAFSHYDALDFVLGENDAESHSAATAYLANLERFLPAARRGRWHVEHVAMSRIEDTMGAPEDNLAVRLAVWNADQADPDLCRSRPSASGNSPTTRCQPRRCPPRRCPPRRCQPRRCQPRRCPPRRCQPRRCQPRRCQPRRCGASLDGARLDGARLDGASLVGASLVGASLDGARLDGASLDGATVPRRCQPRRCQPRFTISDYRTHVLDSYPDQEKGAETLQILDFFEARMSSLGIAVEAPPAPPAKASRRKRA